MSISPHRLQAIDNVVHRLLQGQSRYAAVTKTTGVPLAVIAPIHERESSGNFRRWLHNGDPMRDSNGKPVQTVNVPKERPPDPNVFWEVGAFDALEHAGLVAVGANNWSIERALYSFENFNGLGYWLYHRTIPSPYLFSWSSLYTSGKYVTDGIFSDVAIDHQVGCAVLMKRLFVIEPSLALVSEAELRQSQTPMS